MKTTLMTRQIANPRRTTLAHLKDAAELNAAPAGAEQPDTQDPDTQLTAETGAGTEARALPQRTANPRRTVLTELPTAPVAP